MDAKINVALVNLGIGFSTPISQVVMLIFPLLSDKMSDPPE